MLFVCFQCGCVDDVDIAYCGRLPPVPDDQVCTLCKTGEWHGHFPHAPYNPEKDLVSNRPTGIGLG